MLTPASLRLACIILITGSLFQPLLAKDVSHPTAAENCKTALEGALTSIRRDYGWLTQSLPAGFGEDPRRFLEIGAPLLFMDAVGLSHSDEDVIHFDESFGALPISEPIAGMEAIAIVLPVVAVFDGQSHFLNLPVAIVYREKNANLIVSPAFFFNGQDKLFPNQNIGGSLYSAYRELQELASREGADKPRPEIQLDRLFENFTGDAAVVRFETPNDKFGTKRGIDFLQPEQDFFRQAFPSSSNYLFPLYPGTFTFNNTYLPHLIGVASARMRTGGRTLVMGSGPGLELPFLSRTLGSHGEPLEIHGVDINPVAIANANAIAVMSGFGDSIRVWQSDLFENVEGTYDHIIFDAPFPHEYASAEQGPNINTEDPHGYLRKRFLEDLPRYLSRDGMAFMMSDENLPDELPDNLVAEPLYVMFERGAEFHYYMIRRKD